MCTMNFILIPLKNWLDMESTFWSGSQVNRNGTTWPGSTNRTSVTVLQNDACGEAIFGSAVKQWIYLLLTWYGQITGICWTPNAADSKQTTTALIERRGRQRLFHTCPILLVVLSKLYRVSAWRFLYVTSNSLTHTRKITLMYQTNRKIICLA